METPMAPPSPGGVAIGALKQAAKHKRKYDAVLTLEDPKARHWERLRFHSNPCPDHLILSFEDCDDEAFGFATMLPDQMDRVLAFGRRHAQGSLLVHCLHGIGRSTACALAIVADRMGPGREADAVAAVLALRPHATPNLVAVGLADAALGLNGALDAALAASEADNPVKLSARKARHDLATDMPHLFAKRMPAG